MKYFACAALAAALSTPSLRAQDGLAGFERDYGSGWTVWNGPDGVPYRVFGPGARVLPDGVYDVAAAKRAAGILMRRHGAWLGVEPDTVVLRRAVAGANLVFVEYQQTSGGVRVHDALVQFVFNRYDGGLALIGSEAVRNLGVGTQPGLPAAAALARFKKITGWDATKGTLLQAPILEIYRGTGATWRLTWRIGANFDDRPEAWTLWLDARTGTEVGRQSEIFECIPGTHPVPRAVLRGNVKGMVSPPPRGVTNNNPPKALPMSGVRVDVPGVGTTFTDANGDFSLSYSGTKTIPVTFSLGAGRYWSRMRDDSNTPVLTASGTLDPTKTVNFLFNPTPSEFRTAQANAAKFMMDMHDYAKRVVPSMTVIDRVIQLRVNINRSCNAFYNGGINFYRKRGSCNNTASASVIAHEYGHGIDSWNGGIGRTPRTPSEGIADVCSIYLVDHPVVGLDFRTSGGAVRTALNTLTHPLTGSTQAVHTFGQPLMGWSWDWLVAARATHGLATGKRIAENAIFRGIQLNGRDMLDYILKFYVADDSDSNLNNGTPHIDDLSKASLKRHFVRRVFHNIRFTHTPVGDLSDASKGLRISTDVTAAIGKITGVDLFFDAGAGFVKTAMTPVGPNGWTAKAAPVAGPRLARYYFVARASTGNTLRNPPESNDAFPVAVGRKTLVFGDTFESSTGAWTASRWTRGRPIGRNYDPPSAASGTICYNVNRSSSDERYSTTAGTATLTSRGFSTIGRKGMRLRFRRWMTSDNYSTGRVLVNGTAVQTARRTNDQDWRYYDIDVSALADNKASVVLRFEFTNSNPRDNATGGFTLDDVQLYALGKPAAGSWTSFGTGCGSGGIKPVMSSTGTPAIGQTFHADLSGARPSTPAVLFTGFSNKAWGPIVLPLSLAPFGAPGCSLLASGEIPVAAQTSRAGSASVPFAVPASTSLIGAMLYQQFASIDKAANTLGILTTNGGAAKIGG